MTRKKSSQTVMTVLPFSNVHLNFIVDNETEDVLTIHEHALRDPLLFGDYRNMINKKEQRYYEDLLDYEAIYFLFQEVSVFTVYVSEYERTLF